MNTNVYVYTCVYKCLDVFAYMCICNTLVVTVYVNAAISLYSQHVQTTTQVHTDVASFDIIA